MNYKEHRRTSQAQRNPKSLSSHEGKDPIALFSSPITAPRGCRIPSDR
jgi:hypothetical protein